MRDSELRTCVCCFGLLVFCCATGGEFGKMDNEGEGEGEAESVGEGQGEIAIRSLVGFDV